MKLLNLSKLCGLFLFALFFSFPVLAETKQATVYTKFSDQDIVDILKTEYRDVEILKEGIIRISTSDIKYLISNKGDNLELGIISSDNTRTLSDLNKWNSENRFVYAFFDRSNYLVLKSDLFFEDGITREHLLSFTRRFMIVSALFRLSN